MTPEPKDKLDAATTVVVNGPEDARVLDWNADRLATLSNALRRLRQRIFTASEGGGPRRVRRLQKLMLRSRANTLVSVRRVTERNAGRLTAGVDGEVVLTPEAKRELSRQGAASRPSRSRPSRSDGCISRSRARTSGARSGFP